MKIIVRDFERERTLYYKEDERCWFEENEDTSFFQKLKNKFRKPLDLRNIEVKQAIVDMPVENTRTKEDISFVGYLLQQVLLHPLDEVVFFAKNGSNKVSYWVLPQSLVERKFKKIEWGFWIRFSISIFMIFLFGYSVGNIIFVLVKQFL